MDEARYKSAITVKTGNVEFKQKWEEKGIEVFSLPDAEFKKMQEIGMKVYNDYAKSTPVGEEYLKIYTEALYELGFTEESKIFGQ